jgi:hypothetical protein
MSKIGESEAAFLTEGIAKMQSVLGSAGLRLEGGSQASASLGPFASATFRRGEFAIGLIVRGRDCFGGPDYSYENRHTLHEDLFWALGQEGRNQLIRKERFQYVGRDGGDPFDALAADLREVIVPSLTQSEEQFRTAAHRASEKTFGKVLEKMPPKDE